MKIQMRWFSFELGLKNPLIFPPDFCISFLTVKWASWFWKNNRKNMHHHEKNGKTFAAGVHFRSKLVGPRNSSKTISAPVCSKEAIFALSLLLLSKLQQQQQSGKAVLTLSCIDAFRQASTFN